MEILRVEKLCKTYGKGENRVKALDEVSFSVNKGEFVAIEDVLDDVENILKGNCRLKYKDKKE